MGAAVRAEANGKSTISEVQPRPMARRRNLPSGRAVTGGFLIALAALGAFVAARGSSTGPTHRYVVVAHDMLAGTRLEAVDLRIEAVDLPDGMAGRAFTDTNVVAGTVLTTSLGKGELVQASSVVPAASAPDRYQLSIPVERSRALDGSLVAGETVDVVVTYDAGTFVVARRATVLRVDDSRSGSITGGGDLVILLSVGSPDDALAVTHAAQAGKITVVRAATMGADGPDSYRPPDKTGG